ncbi:hypothetical protein L1887_23496 [Cichorium endivia]|nr:hypothetical protein L1887_23496 [Cichorium endivia]
MVEMNSKTKYRGLLNEARDCLENFPFFLKQYLSSPAVKRIHGGPISHNPFFSLLLFVFLFRKPEMKIEESC